MYRSSVCRFPVLAGLLALAPLGCGSSADPRNAKDTALVKGKVTLANQPLSSGMIVFTAANGWTARAPIRNGWYVIAGAPIGEVKIGIVSAGEPGGGRTGRGKYMFIPPRYKDPATSGLTYTVPAGGEQEKNIELAP
jgi:hypothetical protein